MISEHVLLDTQALLSQLIATPSFSKEEAGTAEIIQQFFSEKKITCFHHKHNIWAKNQHFDPHKPSILLNSHHDTVKPNQQWTKNPFEATIENDKLFGLGANDAGASLVCLLNTFVQWYHQKDMPFNLVMAATAEEEISGKNGIESLLQIADFPAIYAAIVGEPINCQMAIAEKGLMVVDAKVHGKAGHAARNEGINAIYLGVDDIITLRNFSFEKSSDLLGPVTCNVTIAHGGIQHNVVPDLFEYTTDCRVNECYTLEEVLGILQSILKAELHPRSIRLQSSKIDPTHPLVLAGKSLGLSSFGSPTLSDQALMPFPSLKIGPGHSSRSHTSDEFIFINELAQGLHTYDALLKQASIHFQNS